MKAAASLNSSNVALMAVCTRKRPEMLEVCLASLNRQNFPEGVTPAILIVDNDPLGSAFPVYRKFTPRCEVAVFYTHAATPGIAAARNAAIDFAISHNYGHICFIDDDELANENWLAGLMHPDYAHVPILYGLHQMTYFQVPLWAQPVKPKKRQPEGAKLKTAYTNNVRISASVFRKLRFDESLGLGGGEDSDYFTRANLAGHEIRYTQRAIAYEAAHPERCTLTGVLNRTYWISAANMRSLILQKGKPRAIAGKAASIIVNPIGGLFGIALGAFVFPIHSVTGSRMVVDGLSTFARSAGRLAAIAGHTPQSYRRTVGR